MNPEIEKIIDEAYQELMDQTGQTNAQKHYPSRETYGMRFRQSFPWAAAVLIAVGAKKTGGEDGIRPA